MGVANQGRYLSLVALVFTIIGVVFWQLSARSAADQISSVTRESTASLSSTNWAIDFYTLRTREAIAELAGSATPDLLALEKGTEADKAAARRRLLSTFRDWIQRYDHFHDVSAISRSGMELTRINRWGDRVLETPTTDLRSQLNDPSVQEALSSVPGRPVRSVTALVTDSPFAEADDAIGSKVVIGLGGVETPTVLLSATMDSRPITDFLVAEASSPPDHYLFVIRMDGVIAVGDELYEDYEYAYQRGVEDGNAKTVVPELWRALLQSQGNGELNTRDGLYVYRSMVAPDENPELDPQAAGEPATQLPSSALVVFYPTSTLQKRNPFAGPMAWLGLGLVYLVTGLFALGYWRQQRQAGRLQAVTDAQAHALGVVKYELHTPAAAIDMMIDSGNRGPERWSQLASASKHLLAIIDDLRLSIAPDRSINERESPISIRQLTLEVDRQLTPLFANRGQLLRFDLPAWSDDLYTGKYFLFRVIITNLMRYAATQSSGREVALRFEREDGEAGSDTIMVFIDTDGQPLNPQEVDRLFLPFDDAGRLGPIAGISLHMIQQWMEELGGTVEVGVSNRGGVAFRMSLALTQVAEGSLVEAEARHQSGAHHALSGHSILVAEDDPLLGPLVEEVLSSQFGLEVVRASNGEDALRELQQRRFDMLLVDYYMPGMDGLGFIEAVRKSDAAVPIIGMCGGEDQFTSDQFISVGTDYVMVKPITRARFDEAMSVLENSRRLKFQQKFPT